MGIDISNNSLTPDEKISLFRSFFRGRKEVYPRRFENRKSGKTGYAPVCSNEWVRGICAKPKIKCSECAHRAFLPVTDDVIRWHLSGVDNRGIDFVMGVYPMLLDEKCFFLAADFDKASWQEDALAFFKTCRQMNLPAAIERSRSGKGAHVWLFFETAIPAALARKLGTHILTETMESRPDIGFDSYDRFFPNQDTLPKGGFGNLVALPLQKKARGLKNSVFVDDHLVAYEDQWAFLSSMQKISLLEVEKIVREAKAKDRIIGVKLDIPDEDETSPWKMSLSRQRSPIIGPMPSTLEIIISNEIYIPKEPLSPSLRNRFLPLAAFQNPEFYRSQAMRLPIYDKPRIIACARDYPHHIGLPRGVLKIYVKYLQI